MPSPICTVSDGGAAAQVTTAAYATATPGNTVTIALADTTGVNVWGISCIGADETSDAAAVTASLTINSVAKTATFTAPAVGKAYIFQSQIEGGLLNGRSTAAYTTTFKVATLTEAGLAVCAVNETTEHSAAYGWTGALNGIIRSASEFVSGIIKAATVDWQPGGVTTYRIKASLVSVQTTDATQTTLATYAAPDARVVDYTAIVTGYRPSNGDSYRVELGVTYKRFGGGAPAIIGSLVTANTRADAGAASWAATFDASSNNIRVRVTGQAAATINWSCELRGQERS